MGYEGVTEEAFRKTIPFYEIQKYEGNCWATTLSMMLRCHNFDISQKYVTDLFFEWRFDGVTSEQMSNLVQYFNKNLLSKNSWVMKVTDHWDPMLSYIRTVAPVQVFIKKHFLLLLGYDDDQDEVTYFDPWNGAVYKISRNTFEGYGNGETVYMYKE